MHLRRYLDLYLESSVLQSMYKDTSYCNTRQDNTLDQLG